MNQIIIIKKNSRGFGICIFHLIFGKIDYQKNIIPQGTFVRVIYPLNEFLNVFRLPETALYGDKVYVAENGIAKERKISLKHKSSGYVIIDGDLSEKDQIIITKIPNNLNNQKITITN